MKLTINGYAFFIFQAMGHFLVHMWGSALDFETYQQLGLATLVGVILWGVIWVWLLRE